jgi:hypothetical protein
MIDTGAIQSNKGSGGLDSRFAEQINQGIDGHIDNWQPPNS